MTGIDGDREGEEWQDGDGEPLETERLALDDEDERLPWLESSDDEDYAESEGSDMGHTLRLGLLAMAALAAIVLGIYWITHRNPDPALTPDGSLVAAEATPYKEAPKDPGGKTFDGTGDSAFAVSEGQTRSAKLGDAGASAVPASRPSLTSVKVPASSATPSAASSATAKGPVVQVGAYSTQATAETGWSKLAAQYSALAGLKHQIVEGQADIGTVYRLQVLPGESGGAQALCSRLKAAGLACQVKG